MLDWISRYRGRGAHCQTLRSGGRRHQPAETVAKVALYYSKADFKSRKEGIGPGPAAGLVNALNPQRTLVGVPWYLNVLDGWGDVYPVGSPT